MCDIPSGIPLANGAGHNMHTSGSWSRLYDFVSELMVIQERSDPKDDHVDDAGQRCVGIVPRRAQEHCYR